MEQGICPWDSDSEINASFMFKHGYVWNSTKKKSTIQTFQYLKFRRKITINQKKNLYCLKWLVFNCLIVDILNCLKTEPVNAYILYIKLISILCKNISFAEKKHSKHTLAWERVMNCYFRRRNFTIGFRLTDCFLWSLRGSGRNFWISVFTF